MPLIDADVHNAFADVRAELRPFLPRLWQDFADRHGVAVPPAGYVSPVGVQREDARPPSGAIAGSDPGHLIKDHLDRLRGRLRDPDRVAHPRRLDHFDPDWGNALATAYNMNLAGALARPVPTLPRLDHHQPLRPRSTRPRRSTAARRTSASSRC
jgi:hypothetical protein